MGTTSVAKISLAAIRNNLQAVRAHVGKRLVLAAVKANAYGHGSIAVSQMIQETKAADWLGVATVPEGLALRDSGITLPILKLSVARDEEVAIAVANDIVLPIVDELSLQQIAQAAAKLGKKAIAHLKVDSGMGRIGVHMDETITLVQKICATENVVLQGIFSHMPVSDDPDQNDFSQAQIAAFRKTCSEVEALTGSLLKHLSNSGAVLAHREAWLDMVRPGIMIYGAYPSPEVVRSVPLEAALTWKTAVSFKKYVKAGQSISYGRTWTAPQDTWIATIPVGYGDGYSRLLSNKGSVLIKGARYPITGRVCMDQFMVDLGAQTDVNIGAEVTLIGADGAENISTDDLATAMGTIPYEVTCVITSRVQREY